jgi:hypothetical protein
MESLRIAARSLTQRPWTGSQLWLGSKVLLGSVMGSFMACLLLAGCGVTTAGQKPPPPASQPPAGGDPAVAQPGTVPGTPAPGQPVVQARRHRFDMDSPANDDFSVELEGVHIYIRPYEDYLSMKLQGREGNRVRVLWIDSEFTDIVGRRYKLVPPGTTMQDAAYSNIPPLDVVAGQTWSGKVVLLDEAQARSTRNLNSALFPIVPADAGTPEQIKGKEFSLKLAIELNSDRRDYDFLFSVIDVYYQ